MSDTIGRRGRIFYHYPGPDRINSAIRCLEKHNADRILIIAQSSSIRMWEKSIDSSIHMEKEIIDHANFLKDETTYLKHKTQTLVVYDECHRLINFVRDRTVPAKRRARLLRALKNPNNFTLFLSDHPLLDFEDMRFYIYAISDGARVSKTYFKKTFQYTALSDVIVQGWIRPLTGNVYSPGLWARIRRLFFQVASLALAVSAGEMIGKVGVQVGIAVLFLLCSFAISGGTKDGRVKIKVDSEKFKNFVSVSIPPALLELKTSKATIKKRKHDTFLQSIPVTAMTVYDQNYTMTQMGIISKIIKAADLSGDELQEMFGTRNVIDWELIRDTSKNEDFEKLIYRASTLGENGEKLSSIINIYEKSKMCVLFCEDSVSLDNIESRLMGKKINVVRLKTIGVENINKYLKDSKTEKVVLILDQEVINIQLEMVSNFIFLEPPTSIQVYLRALAVARWAGAYQNEPDYLKRQLGVHLLISKVPSTVHKYAYKIIELFRSDFKGNFDEAVERLKNPFKDEEKKLKMPGNVSYEEQRLNRLLYWHKKISVMTTRLPQQCDF